MRILIDGKDLALDEGTGVASYARNLAQCVDLSGRELAVLYGRRLRSGVDLETAFFDARQAGPRSSSRYLMDLARAMRPLTPAVVPRGGHVIRRGREGGLPERAALWNAPSLFHTARARFGRGLGFVEIIPPEPVAVAHWTQPVPIKVRGAVNVYAILDLIPLRLPYATLDDKATVRGLLDAIVATGDPIVTISETSRRDIVDILGAAPERVENLSLCVRMPPPHADADLAADLATLAPDAPGVGGGVAPLAPGGYFLYVGAIEPKKNLARIMEAYLASGAPEPLVLVGRFAWSYEAEQRLIERSPRILHLGYLPTEQVAALMRGARALVFASLYEGFGMPVAEAFLCGAPVIASDRGAIAEVAGGAALGVDPYDVRAIRDAFRALSGPHAEPRRAALSAQGLLRAEAFLPERIAPRLDAYYRGLLAERGRRS